MHDETDNINNQQELLEESESQLKDSEKQQKKLKRKLKAKDMIIVLLIIIILLLLFLRSCAGPALVAPKIQTGTLVEQEKEEVQEVNRGRIFAPAIPDFSVSKEEPYINLFSPEENAGNYLLKYQFVNTETGEVIYESDYLEGGFQYSVDFGSLLEVGEYDVTVNLTSKDAVTYEDKNGTVTQIKVTILG